MAEIAKLNGKTRFVSVVYESKGSGEVARHTFLIGANYRTLLVRSMDALTKKIHALSGIDLEAAQELLKSYSKSLLAIDTQTVNPDYTKAGIYENLCDGLALHKEDGSLELRGLSIKKEVIKAGVHKTVNSRPLTIAKNNLSKDLPVSRYRSLSIDEGAMQTIAISGRKLAL